MSTGTGSTGGFPQNPGGFSPGAGGFQQGFPTGPQTQGLPGLTPIMRGGPAGMAPIMAYTVPPAQAFGGPSVNPFGATQVTVEREGAPTARYVRPHPSSPARTATTSAQQASSVQRPPSTAAQIVEARTLTPGQTEVRRERDLMDQVILGSFEYAFHSLEHSIWGTLKDTVTGAKKEWDAAGTFFKDWTTALKTGDDSALKFGNVSKAMDDIWEVGAEAVAGALPADAAIRSEAEGAVPSAQADVQADKAVSKEEPKEQHWSKGLGARRASIFCKGIFKIATAILFKPLEYAFVGAGSILGGLFKHEKGKDWGQKFGKSIGQFLSVGALKLASGIVNRAISVGENIVRTIAAPFQDIREFFSKEYWKEYNENLSSIKEVQGRIQGPVTKEGGEPETRMIEKRVKVEKIVKNARGEEETTITYELQRKPIEGWKDEVWAQKAALWGREKLIKNLFKLATKLIPIDYALRAAFGGIAGLVGGMEHVEAGRKLGEECNKYLVAGATAITAHIVEIGMALGEHVLETSIQLLWTDGLKRIGESLIEAYEAVKTYKSIAKEDRRDWRDSDTARITAMIAKGAGTPFSALAGWCFKLLSTTLGGTIGALGGFKGKDAGQELGKEIGEGFWKLLNIIGNGIGERIAALAEVGVKSTVGTVVDAFRRTPENLPLAKDLPPELGKGGFWETLDFIWNGIKEEEQDKPATVAVAKQDEPAIAADAASIVTEASAPSVIEEQPVLSTVAEGSESIVAQDIELAGVPESGEVLSRATESADSATVASTTASSEPKKLTKMDKFSNGVEQGTKSVVRALGMLTLGSIAFGFKIALKALGGVVGAVIGGIEGGREGMEWGERVGQNLWKGARGLSEAAAIGVNWALRFPIRAAVSFAFHIKDTLHELFVGTFRDLGDIFKDSKEDWNTIKEAGDKPLYRLTETLYKDADGNYTTDATTKEGAPNKLFARRGRLTTDEQIPEKSRNIVKTQYQYEDRHGNPLYRASQDIYKDAAGNFTNEPIGNIPVTQKGKLTTLKEVNGQKNDPEMHKDWNDAVGVQMAGVFIRGATRMIAKIGGKILEAGFSLLVGSFVSATGRKNSEQFNKWTTKVVGEFFYQSIYELSEGILNRALAILEMPFRDLLIELQESRLKLELRKDEYAAQSAQISGIASGEPDQYGVSLVPSKDKEGNPITDKNGKLVMERRDKKGNIVTDWKYRAGVQRTSLWGRSAAKLVAGPVYTAIIGWPLRLLGGTIGAVIGGRAGKEEGIRIAKVVSNFLWEGASWLGRAAVSHPVALFENVADVFKMPGRKEGEIGWGGQERGSWQELWNFARTGKTKEEIAEGVKAKEGTEVAGSPEEIAAGLAKASAAEPTEKRWFNEPRVQSAAQSGRNWARKASAVLAFIPLTSALSFVGGAIGSVLWGFKGKEVGQKLGFKLGFGLWRGTCALAHWIGKNIIVNRLFEAVISLGVTLKDTYTETTKNLSEHYAKTHATLKVTSEREDIGRLEKSMRYMEIGLTEIALILPAIAGFGLKAALSLVGRPLATLIFGPKGDKAMKAAIDAGGKALWEGTCWVGRNVIGNRISATLRSVQDAYNVVSKDLTRGLDHVATMTNLKQGATKIDRPLLWHVLDFVGSGVAVGFVLLKYALGGGFGLIGAIVGGKAGKEAGARFGEALAYIPLSILGRFLNWISQGLNVTEGGQPVDLGVAELRREVHDRLVIEDIVFKIQREWRDKTDQTDMWGEPLPTRIIEGVQRRLGELQEQLATEALKRTEITSVAVALRKPKAAGRGPAEAAPLPV